VKRGEIWSVAFTSDQTDAPLFRLVIEPSELNGLPLNSRVMVDKATTVPKTKLGKRIGCSPPTTWYG